MSITMRIPEPIAHLIERGSVDVADVESSFAAHAADTAVYSILTDEQKLTLLAGSGLDARTKAAVQRGWDHPAPAAIDWQARQVDADLLLLDSSPTIREVATELGVVETTVSRWHKAGQVVGFVDSRSRIRLPRWQFTTTGVLPGWRKVASHARGLSLTLLADVMQQATDELGDQTPRQFLLDGGDPHLVAELLDGLRQW